MTTAVVQTWSREKAYKKALKYAAIFQASFNHATVYVGDVIGLGVMIGARVWLLFQLYAATFASAGVQVVEGLTLPMTLWSVTVAQCLQMASGSRLLIVSLQDEIKSGNIAHTLSKPYSFLGYLFASYLGRFIARLAGSLVVSIAVAWLLAGFIPLTWQSLLASAALGLLGISLNAVMSFIIGLCAFWTEDVAAYRWIYDKMQWTFSGMVIPLAFFPPTLRTLSEFSPFGQLFYGPARLLVGYDGGLFVQYLVTQVVWLAALCAAMILLYRKGVKNVAVNGG